MSPDRSFAASVGCRAAMMLVVAMAFVPGTANAAAADLPASFPSGAIAYLEWGDAGKVVDRLRNSAYWTSALDSPQWRQLRETPQWRQVEAGSTLLERQLGMDVWTAGDKLLGHRAAVALYPRDQAEKPNVVLVLRTEGADSLAQFRERLAPLLALAEDKLRVSKSLDGVEQINLDDQGYVAWNGDWLAFSDSQPLLDGAVKLLSGGEGKNLSQDEPFQEMVRQADWNRASGATDVRLLRLYVNSSMLHQAAGGRFVPEKLDNALGSLLFGEAMQMAARSPYLSATIDVNADGWMVQGTMAGNRAVLGEHYASFFPPDGAPGVEAFPEVPELLGGVTLYRDFSAWYDHREQLLQEQLMPEFDKFESGLANLLPGKDFGQDVLPLLGKRLTFVSAPQDFAHLDGAPSVKLPGFALVVELAKPDEAAAILQLFTQTLAAILNIEAGQQGRQPWVMTSEAYHGVQIAYAAYLDKPRGDQLGIAFNFLPATARVADKYILSSSLGLCRQLVDALQQPASDVTGGAPRTIDSQFHVQPISDLLEANRTFFHGRMIQDGRTAEEATAEFDALLTLLRSFSSLRLSTVAAQETFRIQFQGSWK